MKNRLNKIVIFFIVMPQIKRKEETLVLVIFSPTLLRLNLSLVDKSH